MANVITFFGGDAKTGTTMLAQSAAELLAKKKKVLLIFASSEFADEFMSETPERSIDMLKGQKTTTIMELEEIIIKGKKFDVIRGLRDPLIAKYFEPVIMQEVTEVLDDSYEYIIIDGGHDIQCGLPVGSLTTANKRYYVVTPNEKTITRFQKLITICLNVLGMFEEDDRVILNKANNKSGNYTPEQVEKLFERKTFSVPVIEDSAFFEVTRKTMLGTSPFDKALDPIIADILGEKATEKKAFFRDRR